MDDELNQSELSEAAGDNRDAAEGRFAITIGQTRASDLAEKYIRSLIFSGWLRPGDKLPSERELAAQFGIARITLRAALRSLETVGFLVIKIGSKGGAWINDAATIRARWEDWMRAHHHEIDEMLEFRRMVETRIAYLAAERRAEDELQLLESLAKPPREDQRSVSQWHVGFHDALAKAAHNRFLEQAMLNIRGELFVPADWAMTHKRVAEIEGVHDAILYAVRDQDPERAAAEMGIHLDQTERPFREVEARL
jgi:GntR family transcriptional regulator, transcriptional repressor for pyruvate dehydrogenase complex